MKALKLFALSYLIKTIVVAIAWLFIPDLPARATAFARESWAWVGSAWTSETRAAVAPAPSAK